MSVLVVGLSHRSAPVEVLERACVSSEDVPKLLDELTRSGQVGEAVVLSTCNRVEVYAVVEAFHGGLADVSGVLARHAGLDVHTLSPYLYVHYAASAVEHLFSVAAGLDSMVVGEAQILGQLRSAYGVAVEAGTARASDARAGPAGTAGRKAFAHRDRDRRGRGLGGLGGIGRTPSGCLAVWPVGVRWWSGPARWVR